VAVRNDLDAQVRDDGMLTRRRQWTHKSRHALQEQNVVSRRATLENMFGSDITQMVAAYRTTTLGLSTRSGCGCRAARRKRHMRRLSWSVQT
tara:strand:- start:3091 stop:3366 length:276 start_codon:yes stop_codon:yes gene_type:complete